jgi:hypothetical protein
VNIVVVVIGVLVGALFLGSVISFARERTGWRSVQLFGSCCLVVVVLTHVAEELHLLPGMGWGLPNTPGHYLDLYSTIIGLILLPLGYVLARRRNSSWGSASFRNRMKHSDSS